MNKSHNVPNVSESKVNKCEYIFFLNKFQNYGEFSTVSKFYHFQDKGNYIHSQKKGPRLIWYVVFKTGWKEIPPHRNN